MNHKVSQLYMLYKDNKIYKVCIYNKTKSRPHVANSGYLSVRSFVLPPSVGEPRDWNIQNDKIHFSFLFHEMCKRIFHCKWAVWGGMGCVRNGYCWKFVGLKKNTTHPHTHTHTNTHKHTHTHTLTHTHKHTHTHTHTHSHTHTHTDTRENLGAFADHLKKMIVNFFVFIRCVCSHGIFLNPLKWFFNSYLEPLLQFDALWFYSKSEKITDTTQEVLPNCMNISLRVRCL
jgi:hypothetical protein